MSEPAPNYATSPIEPADAGAGFSCGKHPLDDYLARHALANDRAGVGRVYVLRRAAGDDASELPSVLGFYTLSMALADSAQVSRVLEKKLPKYPMPVALIGRLAVDRRAQGRRLGEKLLLDAGFGHREQRDRRIMNTAIAIVIGAKRRWRFTCRCRRPPSVERGPLARSCGRC